MTDCALYVSLSSRNCLAQNYCKYSHLLLKDTIVASRGHNVFLKDSDFRVFVFEIWHQVYNIHQ